MVDDQVRTASGTPEDAEWEKRAKEAQLEALPALRSSAEKWAATLGFLLTGGGVAALLKGPGVFNALDDMARDVGKLSFFAGAIAGLVAMVLASIAAQVSVRKLSIVGAGAQRASWESGIKTAVCQLRWSRIAAVLALLALLVSAGCLWFGDKAEQTRLAVDVDGKEVCGKPTTEGGKLVLVEGKQRYEVPATVKRLVAAKRCP